MAKNCVIPSKQIKDVAKVSGENPHLLAAQLSVISDQLGKDNITLEELLSNSPDNLFKGLRSLKNDSLKAFKEGIKYKGTPLSYNEVDNLFKRVSTYNKDNKSNYKLNVTRIGESQSYKATIVPATRIKDIVTNFKLDKREFKRDISFYQGLESPTKESLISANALMEQESMNQVTPSSTRKAEKALNNQLKNWLSSMGIDYNAVNTLVDDKGNPISAIAKADFLRKVVEVIEGKADVTTLSEETAHFFLRMFKDKAFVSRLKESAKKSNTYQQVLAEYQDNLEGNEDLIAEETAAKLIAQEIVKEWDNNSDKYTVESDKTKKEVNNIFTKLIDWVKNTFKNLFFSSKDIINAEEEFRQAAQSILSIDTSNLDSTNLSGQSMYQMSEDRIAYRDKVEKILEDTTIVKDSNSPSGYSKADGTNVPYRASDFVKLSYLRTFKNPNAEISEYNMMLAQRGTVQHLYYEKMMQLINEGKSFESISYEDIKEIVREELSQSEDFNNNPNFDNLISMSPAQFKHIYDGLKAIHSKIIANSDKINRDMGTNIAPKFYYETIVGAGDTAGTLDLMVLYPNGTVAIYDYKNIKFKTYKGEIISGLAQYKYDHYNIQLTTYKNMLLDMGVESFAESRIIPINMQVKNNGSLHNIEMGREKNNLLEQITTGHELTAFEGINTILEKLYNRQREIAKRLQKTPYNEGLKARAEGVRTLISKILVNQDYGYAYDAVKDLLTAFTAKEKLSLDNPNSLNQKFCNEVLQALKVFEDYSYNVKKALGEDINDELKQVLDAIPGVIEELKGRVLDKQLDFLRTTKTISVIDPTMVGKEYGGMELLLLTSDEVNHPLFRKYAELTTLAKARKIRKVNEFIDELEPIDKALESWAKSNGLSKREAFLKLFNKDTGRLFSIVNPKFHSDYQKAMDSQNKEFMLKHFMIERTPKGVYQYVGEAKALFEERRAKEEAILKSFNYGDEFVYDNMKQWDYKYNISNSKDTLFDKKNYFLRKNWKSDAMKAYHSNEYKFIQSNKPLLDYYDFHRKAIDSFEDATGHKLGSTFVANIRQSLADKVSNNGFGALLSLRDDILHAAEMEESSVGAQDRVLLEEDLVSTDVDGKPIRQIPLLWTRPLVNRLTSKELEEVEAKIPSSLKPGSLIYNQTRESLINNAQLEKGKKDKSFDLSSNLIMLADSSYTHEAMSAIEDDALALLQLAKTTLVSTKIDSSNTRVINRLKNKILASQGITEGMISALEKHMLADIYGKTEQSDWGTWEVGGKKISKAAALRNTMRFFSYLTLGFEPLIVLRQAIQVTTTQYMEATEGLIYTEEQLNSAMSESIKNKDKFQGASKFFSIGKYGSTEQSVDTLSYKKGSKVLTPDSAFSLFREVDNRSDQTILVAMAKAYTIKDGKVELIRRLSEEERKSAKSLYETLNKDDRGKWSIENLSEEQWALFRSKVHRVNSRIKGNLTHEQRLLGQSNALIAAFMQFRTWIPGTLKARFGGTNYDPVLDMVNVGRYIVALQDVGGFKKENFQTFTNLAISSIPILGYYFGKNIKSNEVKAKKIYDKFLLENPDSKVTFDEFVQLRVSKLRGMASELRTVLGLLILGLMAKAMVPEPKEREKAPVESFFARNMYKILYGSFLEASFFMSMSSFDEILNSPIAVAGLFRNIINLTENTFDEARDFIMGKDYKGAILWEEEEYINAKGKVINKDKKGIGYYGLSFIPFGNAMKKWFDPYGTFNVNANKR